jgi:DNA-binding NarL/FixJ family response regulator
MNRAVPSSSVHKKSRSISIVIADDHPAVVHAATEVLRSEGLEIVGKAHDGRRAVELVCELEPDIALIDLRMPGLGGLEVARRLSLEAPQTKVVLYTGHPERATLTEMMDSGAAGILNKETSLEELVRAIRLVAAGHKYVDPVWNIAYATHAAKKGERLTQRERDVLALLAEGYDNNEIARRLFLSSETVRTHVRKALKKLNAKTRVQAVALAIREGYLPDRGESAQPKPDAD